MGKGMKILIADDDTISRMVLTKALENRGYKVLPAADGQEGWNIFRREKDSIYMAILDWIMPGMNGLELCRRIKAISTAHYVYVIFLSGKKHMDDIVEGFETGADDYLTKPFDKRELLSRIQVGQRIVELQQALQEANRKLHDMAVTDDLTGIPNRRALFDHTRQEIARAGREQTPLCIIMLDIDHFKRVNDECGHMTGDEALIRIAKRITSILRPYDTIGRYGGEEFLICLSQTNADTGMNIAERIRTCICDSPFEIRDKRLHISVSLGVTSFVPPVGGDVHETLEHAIHIADNGLYDAKNAGRNKVAYKALITTTVEGAPLQRRPPGKT
jgi:diguanylate cyclase (GGDEF)-like protein